MDERPASEVGGPVEAVERPGPVSLGGGLLGRQLVAIAILAAATRLVWIAVFARTPIGLSDPALYHDAAVRLSEGEGYRSVLGEPTAYYPPGYPAVLSWLYRLVDLVGLDAYRATVVGVVQSLWWGISAAAVTWTTRCVAGPRPAIAAGLTVALWPNLITYAGAHLTESLFVMLTSVGLAALVWLARPDPLGRNDALALAILIVTLGPAVLIRPQAAAVMVAVIAAGLLARLDARRVIAVTVTLAAATTLWAAPWVARNQNVVGGNTLISTNNGTNLCIGYNADGTGAFGQFAACDTGERYVDGPAAERRIDAENRRRAFDHIADEPLGVPLLIVKKFWATFGTDDDGLRANESFGAVEIMHPGVRTVWRFMMLAAYTAIMAAALIGLAAVLCRVRPLRGSAPILTVLLVLAVSLAVPLLVFGDPRFKVSFAPQLAVLAGVGWIAILDRVRGSAAD